MRRTLKIELLKRLDRREMRLLEATDYGATLPFLDLGLEQSFQIAQVRLLPADRFLGQTGELLGYGGQIELAGVLLNRCLCDRLGCVHWITSVAAVVWVQLGRSCS